MEISLDKQAAALLLALGLGLGMGLLYDFLRLPRRRGSRALAAALDAAFALGAGAALFSFAMAAGSGRLGTWELAAALAGFLLYMHGLSPSVLPLLERSFQLAGNLLRRGAASAKKVHIFVKNLFPKIEECIKMKK